MVWISFLIINWGKMRNFAPRSLKYWDICMRKHYNVSHSALSICASIVSPLTMLYDALVSTLFLLSVLSSFAQTSCRPSRCFMTRRQSLCFSSECFIHPRKHRVGPHDALWRVGKHSVSPQSALSICASIMSALTMLYDASYALSINLDVPSSVVAYPLRIRRGYDPAAACPMWYCSGHGSMMKCPAWNQRGYDSAALCPSWNQSGHASAAACPAWNQSGYASAVAYPTRNRRGYDSAASCPSWN